MHHTESFDHPPSPAELEKILIQSEENDPRSLFYKRTLVRPKLSIGKILGSVLAIILAGGGVFAGILCLWHNVWLALLGGIVTLLLIGLVFAKQILIGMVRIYQAVASEKVRNRCRYEPSCSVYMIQSVEKYGFWRGFRKGMKRWRSCKPPNGGFDLP